MTKYISSLQELSDKLKDRKIHSSYQRMKVLEYLNKNQCHPTVDQIYKDLRSEIPTISKSTVYNTLNLFLEAGLIRELNIEDNESRFDIITKNHGHFKCERCGRIYNFNIDFNNFKAEGLAGFEIKDKNVYFKGTCPECLSKRSNHE